MAAKRKTLPNHFDVLIKTGSLEAQRVCELIDAPFFLNDLQNALSCEEGDIMAKTFEKETGLSILVTKDMCKQE